MENIVFDLNENPVSCIAVASTEKAKQALEKQGFTVLASPNEDFNCWLLFREQSEVFQPRSENSET